MFFIHHAFTLTIIGLHMVLDKLISGIIILKKMITLLSTINKRAIYKTYPSRCFIDKDSLVEYGKNFKNLKVISDKFDFRYVNVIGDIFILV